MRTMIIPRTIHHHRLSHSIFPVAFAPQPHFHPPVIDLVLQSFIVLNLPKLVFIHVINFPPFFDLVGLNELFVDLEDVLLGLL